MNFVEAIRVIKNIIPQCSANEYDGILVKRLEASNTQDEGRTTNQTHIAISAPQKLSMYNRDEKQPFPSFFHHNNILFLFHGF